MESCIDVEVRPVRYATRQPVFAADGTVIGYKLLFRTDVVSHFSTGSSDESGTAAIEVSTLLSLDTLCDHRMAFIGCNREVLLQHGLALLPSEKVIAEIEPDVAVDDVIYQQCCDLKNGGYRIALADYSPQDPREPIAHLADFIFIDMHRTGLDEIKSIIGFARWRHSGLVATNVETRADADLARKAGFQFFQGNYFRKPEAMRTRTVQTNRAIYLRLLQAVAGWPRRAAWPCWAGSSRGWSSWVLLIGATPLGGMISARLGNGASDSRRGSLAVTATKDAVASPLVGFGDTRHQAGQRAVGHGRPLG